MSNFEELRDRLLAVSDAVVFGRTPKADVDVDDPYVSARHCRIGRTNGEWWVEELGSTNGTYILRRGGRMEKMSLGGLTRLYPGDRVKIGRTVLPWEVPT